MHSTRGNFKPYSFVCGFVLNLFIPCENHVKNVWGRETKNEANQCPTHLVKAFMADRLC